MTTDNDHTLGVEVELDFTASGGDTEMPDVTYKEIILSESLLNPGLQTFIKADSFMHTDPVKDFDIFKMSNVVMNINRPSLKKLGYLSEMKVSQVVYRLENRSMIDNNNETLGFRACDPTLLTNARALVSKSWKCTTPKDVVNYVLSTCVGATSIDNIESTGPGRDYIAENIHPFQVIAQQKNVALAKGTDPSFLHYMTYENNGTHHFRSLKSLCEDQRPVEEFFFSETATLTGYGNPQSILTYSFPCDFDLLSDILNGVDERGKDINSLMLFNPVNKMFSMVGDQTIGCGIGSGSVKLAQTNYGTAKDQNSCNSNIEQYLLKRQARMALLEQDKIALRLTVPWNPSLNVGKIISVVLMNKSMSSKGRLVENYGSGEYLILHMSHNIQRGGYATTTMDCVSKTAGMRGEV
jgi:hypothetical protein